MRSGSCTGARCGRHLAHRRKHLAAPGGSRCASPLVQAGSGSQGQGIPMRGVVVVLTIAEPASAARVLLALFDCFMCDSFDNRSGSVCMSATQAQRSRRQSSMHMAHRSECRSPCTCIVKSSSVTYSFSVPAYARVCKSASRPQHCRTTCPIASQRVITAVYTSAAGLAGIPF